MTRLVALAALIVCGVLSPLTLVGDAQGLSPVPTVRIGVLRNGSYEVVAVPLETYVARVLTGEALPGSSPAAMEALAVAVRTYTIGNLGRHRPDGFDLCDQTHCQVMRTATPVTEQAALATAGQILTYRGATATIYYSASCGGHTEKPSNVWPGADDPAYLPSKDDDGCGGAPEWSTELKLADLQRALQASGFRGRLTNFRIAARNGSGRAQRLALEGMTPAEISGQDLRAAVGRAIGWQYIQSTNFEVTRSGDAVRLRGHGYGHGVGMCVIGASKLGAAGRSATQILAQYYPGTEIASVAPRLSPAPPEPERPSIAAPPAARPPATTRPPVTTRVEPPPPAGVVVSLPEGDEGERAVLGTQIARARDELARALAVTAPATVTARFYPTTQAYEQATGAPWYTLGAVNASGMHFVPLLILRERGVIDRTLRHQLVHLLTDATLSGRAAWIREGAAIHFAEGAAGPSQRQPCPGDYELLRPASIGALSDAYARARACFERQLTTGRSWQEIH